MLHTARSDRNPPSPPNGLCRSRRQFPSVAPRILGIYKELATIRSSATARVRSMKRFMNAKFFQEQRREMITAVTGIADHMAAQIGKTALDERVLGAMAKVPRHEFVPVEVQSYAYPTNPDRFR